MNAGKVILGALAGAATGAVLGILFAPKSGAVTRRAISRKSKRQVNELKHKFNEFVDTVTEKFEKAKDEMVDIVEETISKSAEAEKEANASKAK